MGAMVKGWTLKGVLVALLVLGMAGFTLLLINNLVVQNADQAQDAKNMRSIYIALSLYEQANDGLPAPDLYTVHRDLGDPSTYLAVNDPFAKADSFPMDPALPNSAKRSPVRISFTYLPQWAKAGKFEVKDWTAELQDVQVGIMASYWFGDIDTSHPDGRGCTGPVVRINMDGSVFRLPQRKNPQTLTVEDLFLRR